MGTKSEKKEMILANLNNKKDDSLNAAFSLLSTQAPSLTSKSISVQCKGAAKSTGGRCKNKTKSENQYCYLHKNQSSDYKAPKKSNDVGRCKAITKAGNQCKRSASSGSKYCWQHK